MIGVSAIVIVTYLRDRYTSFWKGSSSLHSQGYPCNFSMMATGSSWSNFQSYFSCPFWIWLQLRRRRQDSWQLEAAGVVVVLAKEVDAVVDWSHAWSAASESPSLPAQLATLPSHRVTQIWVWVTNARTFDIFECRYNILGMIMRMRSTVLSKGFGKLLVLFQLIGVDWWLGSLQGCHEVHLGNHTDIQLSLVLKVEPTFALALLALSAGCPLAVLQFSELLSEL